MEAYSPRLHVDVPGQDNITRLLSAPTLVVSDVAGIARGAGARRTLHRVTARLAPIAAEVLGSPAEPGQQLLSTGARSQRAKESFNVPELRAADI